MDGFVGSVVMYVVIFISQLCGALIVDKVLKFLYCLNHIHSPFLLLTEWT